MIVVWVIANMDTTSFGNKPYTTWKWPTHPFHNQKRGFLVDLTLCHEIVKLPHVTLKVREIHYEAARGANPCKQRAQSQNKGSMSSQGWKTLLHYTKSVELQTNIQEVPG